MNLVIIICVALGLAFNLFASLVCKGAVLAQIDQKKICISTLIFSAWQLITLVIGNVAAIWIEYLQDSREMNQFTWVGSIFIFAVFAVHMVRKAWKNEPVVERREDILLRKSVMKFSFQMGLPTIFAGMAFGFLGANLLQEVIVIALCAIIVFIAGLYTGYRVGYVHKTVAYIIGALFMIASDVYLIASYFVIA